MIRPQPVPSAGTLTLALIAGAGFGLFGLTDSTYARGVANAAVIKLVATHADQINDKFKVESDQATSLPFAVPFKGKLTVEVKAHSDDSLDIRVIRDAAAEGRPAVSGDESPSPDLPAETMKEYRHAGVVTAGKYRLIVHSAEKSDASRTAQSYTAHLSIDP